MKQISFFDLKVQYKSIKKEIDIIIQDILEKGNFIGGQEVIDFENAFANYIGCQYCITCANGTDALEILLKAMEIGQGDEVLVPAISWIATSEAVSNVGATPVFVDIDEFFTINTELIEEKINEKTKALIPVHLYGQPAEMHKVMQIAKKYNLKVIEDCAQAHGAEINGKKVGAWGDAASFSFYPTKNLGAYGDAGAMLTNNPQIAEKARRISNHGQIKKHEHPIEGRTSRLDTLQAAILLAKLPFLRQWIEARIRNANLYNQLLEATQAIQTPKIRSNTKHVFHLYVVRTAYRKELQYHLETNGVQTAIHYPQALPFLKCYENRGFQPHNFPVAYHCQDEILSLPMYPELTKVEIEYIVSKISNFKTHY